MMTCRTADHLMQTCLDEPLTPQERRLLDGHLTQCAACRQAWDEYRGLSRLAQNWAGRPDPSEMSDDAFVLKTMQAIAAAQPSTQTRQNVWKYWALGACIIAFALVFDAPLWPHLHPITQHAFAMIPSSLGTAASLRSEIFPGTHNWRTLINFPTISTPPGTVWALLIAGVVNILLVTQATRKSQNRFTR